MRKGDAKLLAKVNAALAKLIKSGKLRQVYERWGIWNPVMAATFADDIPMITPSPPPTPPISPRAACISAGAPRLDVYAGYVPLLAKGAVTTVELSLISMSIAIALGLLLALMRLYGPFPVQALATVYVEFIRGSPLLIQLFFIFYGLPPSASSSSPSRRPCSGWRSTTAPTRPRSTARASRPSRMRRWRRRSRWA